MSAPSATAASAAAPVSIHPGLAILVLALLLSIQPVTTDLYLPALPALTRSLGAPLSAAQLTLSGLLLAFGCSQMVWGPLSDRFGRRPVLLAGLSIYTVASVGSALAPSMALLIVWRIAQGAAMGAVVMCARAIVRDLYTPLEGARAMSKALTGLGIVACICAPLGGLLSEWLGWRAALSALTVYALVTLAVVALRMPETLAQRNPQALQPRALAGTWMHVLKSPTFWAFSLQTTATYGGLFTFLAASSFVFIQVLGLSKTQYGLVMFWNSLWYVAGTFLCRYWLQRHGVRGTVARAGVLALAGATTMGVLALAGVVSVWAIALPLVPIMLAHGINQPCGQSGSVGPFPQAAGAASALNGFFMMLVAFCVGGWLGRSMNGTVLPMAYGMWFFGTCAAVAAWTLVQHHGEPQHG